MDGCFLECCRHSRTASEPHYFVTITMCLQRTALHWAASYGNLEHVKMLIKQDSNIGIPDVEGRTPLHWAASSKGTQAVDCVHMILVGSDVW